MSEIRSFRPLIFLSATLVGLLVAASLTGCAPPPPQGASASPQPMSSTEFWFSTIWFLLIGLSVYYLMVIRPQVSAEEGQAKFVKELKKSDEVVTSGGLLGKVIAVYEDHVALDLGNNVKVRVRPEHVKPIPAKVQSAPSSGEKNGK